MRKLTAVTLALLLVLSQPGILAQEPQPAASPQTGGTQETPDQPPQDGGGEDPAQPPQDGGGEENPTQPPQDGGGEEDPAQPPQDGGGEDPAQPPQDGGGEENPAQPPQDGGGEEDPAQPPQDGGGEEDPAQPPQDGGEEENPDQPPQSGNEGEPPVQGGGEDLPEQPPEEPILWTPVSTPLELLHAGGAASHIRLTADLILEDPYNEFFTYWTDTTLDMNGHHILVTAGSCLSFGGGISPVSLLGDGGEEGLFRVEAGGWLELGLVDVSQAEGVLARQEEGSWLIAQGISARPEQLVYAQAPVIRQAYASFDVLPHGLTRQELAQRMSPPKIIVNYQGQYKYTAAPEDLLVWNIEERWEDIQAGRRTVLHAGIQGQLPADDWLTSEQTPILFSPITFELAFLVDGAAIGNVDATFYSGTSLFTLETIFPDQVRPEGQGPSLERDPPCLEFSLDEGQSWTCLPQEEGDFLNDDIYISCSDNGLEPGKTEYNIWLYSGDIQPLIRARTDYRGEGYAYRLYTDTMRLIPNSGCASGMGGSRGGTVDLFPVSPQPEPPGDPGEPTQPEPPDDPGEPPQTEPPDDPGEPSRPELPDDPGEPSRPELPDDPGEPSQPELPDDPGEPPQTELPDDPGEPPQTELPDDPGEPSQPELPDDPGKPSQPELPDDPGEPIQTEPPDDPGEPSRSELPDDPGGPSQPELPDDPGEPSRTEPPDDPARPEGTYLQPSLRPGAPESQGQPTANPPTPQAPGAGEQPLLSNPLVQAAAGTAVTGLLITAAAAAKPAALLAWLRKLFRIP